MARVAKRIHLAFAIGVVILLSLYAHSRSDPTARQLLLVRLNQLPIAIETRVSSWDGKESAKERFCRSNSELQPSQTSIPNIVHFIFLGKDGSLAELNYAHFLAFKAAVLRMDADEIRLHTNGLNTRNRWWQEIRDHIKIVDVNTTEMHAPDGTPIASLQLPHQADLLRLEILAREGGIYLDTDVYALKPFRPLLHNPRDVLMGHEGGNRYGLCNGVILARAGSQFISLWQQSYADFNTRVWNLHSVRRPKQLQVQYPDLICPLSPSVFVWPTWAKKDVKYMHGTVLSSDEMANLQDDMQSFGSAMYEHQLAFHAWGAHHVLNELTPEKVQSVDTRFNVLIRDIANAQL